MKKSTLLTVLTSSLLFLSLSSKAIDNEYRIEVCALPLSEVVMDSVKGVVAAFNLQHMFVRGNDGSEVIGLNFQPENQMNVFGSKAIIVRHNYENATCAAIFATKDKALYDQKWNEITKAYDEAANKYQYNVLDKHCQTVTDEILANLGYQIPEEICRLFDAQKNLQKGVNQALNGCKQQ